MNKKGVILPMVAIAFLILVVLFFNSFYGGGITSAVIGVKAAKVNELVSRGDLDLFVIEKNLDFVNKQAFKSFSLNGGFPDGECKGIWSKKCNPNLKIKENYVDYFIIHYNTFRSNYEVFLEEQYKEQYSVVFDFDEPVIKDDKIFVKITLKYGTGYFEKEEVTDVGYVTSKEFNLDMPDFSVFKEFYAACSVSDYSEVCRKYIVSDDENYIYFELKTKFLGEEIPVNYKVKKIQRI